MSSTTTTWTTDTNTKSGSATTFTNTISTLKIIGSEGEDAILRLFADEGDDNADQWRIVSAASNNKLNFMSLASGSWSNVVSLLGSGTAASQYLSLQTGNKLYLDGAGDTYIQESSADVLDIYVGGANMIKLTESTTDTVTITGDLTVGADDTGHDVKFFGDTATNGYMLWDQSTDDLILGSSSKLGIGHTAPPSNLHIKTASGGVTLGLQATANAENYDIDYYLNSADTITARIRWNEGDVAWRFQTTVDTTSQDTLVISPITGISMASGKHILATDQIIRYADATDNSVVVQIANWKIPAKAIITRVVAVVVVDSNLSTHLVNITMSTDDEFAADNLLLTNRTELLGASAGADATFAATDVAYGGTREDIDMGAGNDEKDVWLSNAIIRNGTSDQYVYVSNAGTGNGDTNSTAGTLSVIIEYYGVD